MDVITNCLIIIFSDGSRISPRWGRQYTILPNFPKNCMKLKECGPPERRFDLSLIFTESIFFSKRLRKRVISAQPISGRLREKSGNPAQFNRRHTELQPYSPKSDWIMKQGNRLPHLNVPIHRIFAMRINLIYKWRIQDFPEGVTPTPEGVYQPIIWQKLLKLHKNGRNWTDKTGARPQRSLGFANVLLYSTQLPGQNNTVVFFKMKRFSCNYMNQTNWTESLMDE